MSEEPLVSIVVPTMQKSDAKDTVDAINNNLMYSNYEVIVAAYPDLDISEARNEGVKDANGSIVAFTDDDAYPQKGWIQSVISHFDDPDVAAVEGCTYGGLERAVLWGYMGVNMFYRKDVLEEVGGFDLDLAGWREDTDLAWRTLDRGYKIVYEPASKVHHPDEPGSSFNTENEKIFLKRHPSRYVKNRVYLYAGKYYVDSLIEELL